MILRFRLTGKVKPYVRMTQRGKWVKPDAIEYRASQKALSWQYKEQMKQNGWEMFPDRTPLGVRLIITVPADLHRSDWDNISKAVTDSAQGIVFRNDAWIDEAHVVKRMGLEHVTEAIYYTLEKETAP